MRIIIWSLLLLMLFSCRNKASSITIYASLNDSIFYCEGNDGFNPEKLSRGVMQDTVFFNAFIKKLKDTSTKKFFKPFKSNEFSNSLTTIKLIQYFNRQNIRNIQFSLLDSSEKKYFGAIDLWEHAAPPGPIKIAAPSSVSEKTKSGEHLLVFALKGNSISYKYDTAINEKNFKRITPNTSAAISKVMDSIEAQYGIQLNKMEDKILIKSDRLANYSSFKEIKKAFKQKEIYKFRIVTNDN